MSAERDAAGEEERARGYLDTATYGLPADATVAAVQAFVAQWRAGKGSWREWEGAADGCRPLFAGLVRGSAEAVALLPSVAAAAATAMTLVPDRGEVLLAEGDFASVVLPALAAARSRGIRVRRAPVARLAEAVGAATRMVAVSDVQSATGERADLDALVEAARAHDAYVFLDATQSLGVVPFEARIAPDLIACAAYKWLRCPRGPSFLHVGPRVPDSLEPLVASWNGSRDPATATYPDRLELAPGAKRFDMPLAWLPWYVARAALEDLLAHTQEQRWERASAVVAAITDGLELPRSPSTIVAVEVPEPAAAVQALASAGVRAAARGGAVRLSAHYYNTLEDAELAVGVLRAFARPRARRPTGRSG